MTDDRIVGEFGDVERFGGYGLSLYDEHAPDYEERTHPTNCSWIMIDESDFSTDIWGWTKTPSSSSAKRQQKAKEFLKSWLTDQEYEDLQDNKLIIPSKLYPDRTYKLHPSASQMVEVYTSGILDHKLCAVAKDPRFENDDTLLAKILMIKTNEEEFLKIAERHEVNLDSGFGRNLTYWSFVSNTDSLTIRWDLTGEVTLRAGSSIQSGQLVTTNERGEVVPYTSRLNNITVDVNSLRLRSRHND